MDTSFSTEIVALDSRGRPSFEITQNSASKDVTISFYAFDLLNKNGELLVNLSLSYGRESLDSLLAASKDPLRLSSLLQAPSGEVLEAVRRLGLEGVVGKRIGSVYEAGERSGAWIKLRVNIEQEFVIGGYIPGARGFDALLVGVYQNKELKFRRKGEKWFPTADPGRVVPALKALQTAQCPFKNLPEKRASGGASR